MFKSLRVKIRSQFAPDLTFTFDDAIALFWLLMIANLFVTTGKWWWLALFLLLGWSGTSFLFKKNDDA